MALSVFCQLLGDAVVYDGRPSRPISHLYIDVPDGAPRLSRAESPFVRTTYPAPIGVIHDSRYVIELKHHRGLQAVMAPSTHPSGELLTQVGSVPPVLSAERLERVLQCVWLARALAVLWRPGERHNFRLWVGAWLCKRGVSLDDARLVWVALACVVDTDHAHDAEFFLAWSGASDVDDQRGIAGVREIAADVLGAEESGQWIDQVFLVWPCLRTAQPALDVLMAEDSGARMMRECTLLTPSAGEARVYDPQMGGSCSVRSYKLRVGRVGQEHVSARGAVSFMHVVDAWLALPDKRVARDVAYMPGEPYNSISSDGSLNVFCRGPIWRAALERYRAGHIPDSAVTWFTDWVDRVIPDAHERNTFLCWIAGILLWPADLRGWAPYMMTHVHGIGRTSMLQVIQHIMGVENCEELSSEAILSSFNDWAGRAVLRYANELRESGKTRGVAAKRLHSAITDARIALNRKGQPVVNIDNYGGYVLIANDIGDMHLTEDSRRFFCVSCGVRRARASEKARFFECATDTEALTQLAQWLMQLEPKARLLGHDAPHSATKTRVVEGSKSGAEEALEDALDGFSIVFTMAQLVERYDGPGVLRRGDRHKTLWGMLRAAGYTKLYSHKNRLRYQGERVTVYVHQRDYMTAAAMTADKVRDLLQQNGSGKPLEAVKKSNIIDITRKN